MISLIRFSNYMKSLKFMGRDFMKSGPIQGAAIIYSQRGGG